MTKKRLWLTVALSALIAPAVVHAQDAQPDYGIKFGGFVKFDAFNDSRQVTAARDDMFLLYPAARSQITAAPATLNAADPTGAKLYAFSDNRDNNALGQTGMTAVQTRLTGKITAPDAFGAKVSGLIEGDFFGPSATTIYSFGLRHAWVNLDWGKTSLRTGQDWHPLFLQGGIFPGTIQFNPIAPIHPFGRAPQIAFTLKPVEGLRITFYALEQSAHADTDTTNTANNTKLLRSAKIPELAVQADYKIGGFTVGGTYDRKVLVPLGTPTLDGTATINQVGQNTNSITYQIYQAYAQLKQGDLTVKASTTWGDNWGSLIGVGGYGVKMSVIDQNLSAILQSQGVAPAEAAATQAIHREFTKRQYSPTQSRGYWAEIAYGKEIEFGIVGGKVENLGAADEINSATLVGSGAGTIAKVITIAPRVKFTQGKTMFGIEYIYSAASYLEDDKNFQAIINEAKVNDGVITGGANYITGAGYTTVTASGLTFANPGIRDSNGRIQSTYTVVNHRIQLSVQQNF